MDEEFVSGIAWTVALLAPWTVAPHQNFSSDVVDGPALLALCADARLSEIERKREKSEALELSSTESELIAAARRSVEYSTQRAAALELDALARGRELSQGARTAAAILASVAFAELDEHDLALALLRDVRHELSSPDPASLSFALTDSALALHDGVRSAQSGAPADEVLDKIAAVEHRLAVPLGGWRYEDFRVSHGVGWNSRRVLLDVRAALRRRATYLRSHVESFEGRTWAKVVRGRPTWLDIRLDWKSASRDAATVESLSHSLLDPPGRRRSPDPRADAISKGYGALLLAELGADIQDIRANQRSLARTLVLLERGVAGNEEWAASEAIRMARSAGDTAFLSDILRRYRTTGPLVSIQDACRGVSNRDRFETSAGHAEFAIIASGGDLLGAEERRSLLARMISIGSAQDFSSRGWSEQAEYWRAISAVVTGSDMDDDVARLILASVELNGVRAATSSGLIAGMVSVNWTSVSPDLKERWERWVGKVIGNPESRDLALIVLEKSDPEAALQAAAGVGGMSFVVDVLNSKESSSSQYVARSAEVVSERLRQVREDASKGRFGVGGVDVGECAVLLAANRGRVELWPAIGDYLVDPALDATQRARALDRLADVAEVIPSTVVEQLSRSWAIVASPDTRDVFFGAHELAVLPSALRAASALRVSDAPRAIEAVCRLLADVRTDVRTEGLRSLPYVAKSSDSSEWAHALALQGALDVEPAVRGEAGRALVLMSYEGSRLAGLIRSRVSELLSEDGIVVPLRVLHGMQKAAEAFDPIAVAPWADAVREVAKSHPSIIVRGAATIVAERN